MVQVKQNNKDSNFVYFNHIQRLFSNKNKDLIVKYKNNVIIIK